MFNFLYSLRSFELACITLIVGVLVSTIIRRQTGIRTGGTLGTAILILAASDSLWWALTLLVITPIVSVLYSRFLGGRFSGREPMFIMSAMSILLVTIGGLILQAAHIFPASSLSFPLGMIFPAITASVMHTQGIFNTYKHLALSVVLTLEVMAIVYGFGHWFNYDFGTLERLAEPRQTLALNWSALFALFSVLVGYFTYRRFRVKAIGFVTLPPLATMAIVSPINFGLLLGTAVVVYLLTLPVRRLVLLAGIGRQAYITLVAVALVWTVDYVVLHRTATFSPYLGTGMFAALVASVMVSEHIRYGVRRAFPLFLASLAAMIVVQIGVSYGLSLASHGSGGLRYYIVRQASDPSRPKQQ